ncbi:MAG: hypothetical protein Q7T55_12570, partial [Solirubrobacteraceae bacterium]|nr:hypothetical protein [Solirubrobacteraceae bacterium]
MHRGRKATERLHRFVSIVRAGPSSRRRPQPSIRIGAPMSHVVLIDPTTAEGERSTLLAEINGAFG